MTLQALINHWYLPDFKMGVPPIKRLKSKDVNKMKRGRQILYEMGKVMSMVEEVARARDVWIDDKEKWQSDKLNQMYYGIIDAFLIPGQGRSDQFSWYTIFR